MKLPRQMIRGKFLENLSQADLRFIVTTLTKKGAEADGLLKLLSDEGTRVSILDSEKLLQAVKAITKPLKFSPALYFYILLRSALRAEGVIHVEAAAFLAEALVAFPPAPRPGVHTSDYEEAIKEARDYEWFVLAVELANRSLILSGIYGEEIYKAKKNYAVASLNRYENLGRNHYRAASRHPLAREFELNEILTILAEDFVKIRTALGSIKDSYLPMVAGRA